MRECKHEYETIQVVVSTRGHIGIELCKYCGKTRDEIDLRAKLEAAETKNSQHQETIRNQEEIFSKELLYWQKHTKSAEQERDDLRRQVEELNERQHGRNWDDDEAERKLNLLADQYKELEHKKRLLAMALNAANDKSINSEEGPRYYSYDPQQDFSQVKTLCNGVIVHIPVDWLIEIVDEKDGTIDALRGALFEVLKDAIRDFNVISEKTFNKVRQSLTAFGDNRYSKIEQAAKEVCESCEDTFKTITGKCYTPVDAEKFDKLFKLIFPESTALGDGE